MASSDYQIPVSCKGIVFEDSQVWLRRNERDEWELPGGKLEPGEQPADTVAREIHEELGLIVQVGPVIANHLYLITKNVDEQRGVLVASYSCEILKRVGGVEYQGEAGPAQFRRFTLSAINALTMPEFYKQAIRLAADRRSHG